MTTHTSDIGALTLPLMAGVVGDKLEDPVVEAMLDFLGFYLNNDLNSKLANLRGTSSVASPADNRYSWDPSEPRGHKIKRPAPSLFVFWDGRSQVLPFSQLQRVRNRHVDALYVFDELPSDTALELRSGLFNAVDGVFAKAADRNYHPLYSYNNTTLGTRLDESIGDLGHWEWTYVGGQGIRRVGIGDTNVSNLGARTAGRHYPGFAGRFLVRELIQPTQPEDPANVLRDSPMTINNDGVEILDRTLEAPDGADAPDA